MKKRFIIGFLLYLVGLSVCVFGIIMPYGTRILTHIQSVVNDHINLDLIYCFKQFMFGLGWIVLLGVVLQVIMIFGIRKFLKN